MAKKKVPAKTAQSNLPALDYGDDAGLGFENQTQADIAIPFIAILQPLSPVVTEGQVEGAKAGMLYNTVTQDLASEITFVPACTEHCYVEWVPREKGGGFVARHDIHSDVVTAAKAKAKKFNDLQTPEGNELVETFYVYVVLTNDDGDALGYAIISCESTKIKVYKGWNTRLLSTMIKRPDGSKVRPPMWAHHCRMVTKQESNNKGTWHNPVLGPAGEDIRSSLLAADDERYQSARELRDLVQSGALNPAYDSVQRTEEAGSADDNEPPF